MGDFFNLADFFHSVKRFVRVANTNVLVGGRLITIEGVQLGERQQLFPQAEGRSIKATVYLSPKSEGATAGATPQGPLGPRRPHAGLHRADSAPRLARPAPTATATPWNPDEDFLLDLWNDLREKRLWPVAALLLAGPDRGAGRALQAGRGAGRPPAAAAPEPRPGRGRALAHADVVLARRAAVRL